VRRVGLEVHRQLQKLYEVSDKDDAPIDWNALSKDFYRLAETENGGFEAAANRYVSSQKFSGSN
jgi:hypothetical protein